jgi:hypothetical protein
MKNVFEYIITKQNKETREENKAFREEMKEDRKTLTDKLTEIEKSVKRSELETQRMNRELLDRFGSKTNKCIYLLSQVSKETEVEMITDNHRIEKNVELMNTGTTETVAERQELSSDVVNVDTVWSLDDRKFNQQINVWRRRKLKKRTQGNGEFRKELIAVHTRVTRHAIPAERKGNMRKRAGSENTARRMPQSSTWEETTE